MAGTFNVSFLLYNNVMLHVLFVSKKSVIVQITARACMCFISSIEPTSEHRDPKGCSVEGIVERVLFLSFGGAAVERK